MRIQAQSTSNYGAIQRQKAQNPQSKPNFKGFLVKFNSTDKTKWMEGYKHLADDLLDLGFEPQKIAPLYRYDAGGTRLWTGLAVDTTNETNISPNAVGELNANRLIKKALSKLGGTEKTGEVEVVHEPDREKLLTHFPSL